MIKNEIAIDVQNITKEFKIYLDKGSQLKEKLLFSKRRRCEIRRVLRGISFQVKRGEAVGLIGHNGCGKSTTLKLLTRIMYPDSGSITMNGRVSSLIELGAGFHPDMSGRENIYTNASIFGLTKKEIDCRLADIIAFSELEDFIDNPVRTYSSGMYMRLAFSVAINVDADILLIDEILAVGDTNFQTKCFNKLRELKATGMTIILVTHDLTTIEKFCDRAIWLNNGDIVQEGKSASVVDAYFRFMNEKKFEQIEKAHAAEASKNAGDTEKNTDDAEQSDVQKQEGSDNNSGDEAEKIDYSANRFGLKYAEITNAVMLDKNGQPKKAFRSGEPLSIAIDYKVNTPLDELVFGMGFYSMDGVCIYGNNTQLDRLRADGQKDGRVQMDISELPLLAGRYALNVAIVDKDGTPMDFCRTYSYFEVVSEDRSTGFVHVEHEWRLSDDK